MRNKKIIPGLLLFLGMSMTSLQAQTVKDIEGNIYKTVKIGTQTWMAENLRTTKFNDGKAIPLVTDTTWHSKKSPAYCWYNNNKAANSKTYGAMYNWFTVKTGKLCPAGWHVPSDSEWMTLVTFAGGENTGGGKLKEKGTVHWKSPNAEATNESGFTALPGGSRFDSDGSYYGMGDYGNWWTSTEFDSFRPGSAFIYMMDYRSGETSKGFPMKQSGASVRCIIGQTVSAVPESSVMNANPVATFHNNVNIQYAEQYLLRNNLR
jgi:uncharacterized protein (TIGR02145 family)